MSNLLRWTRDAEGYLVWDCHSLTEVRKYALDFRARMGELVNSVNALDLEIQRGKRNGNPSHEAKAAALRWHIVINSFLAWADGKPAERGAAELREWAVKQAQSTLKWAEVYSKAQEEDISPPHGYWHVVACELAIIEGFLRAARN